MRHPRRPSPTPGPTAQRTVELHIDHLVVEGLDVRDPHAFRAALEHQLAERLAADPRALDGARDTSTLVLDTPRLPSQGSAAAGSQVARGLIRGLGS